MSFTGAIFFVFPMIFLIKIITIKLILIYAINIFTNSKEYLNVKS